MLHRPVATQRHQRTRTLTRIYTSLTFAYYRAQLLFSASALYTVLSFLFIAVIASWWSLLSDHSFRIRSSMLRVCAWGETVCDLHRVRSTFDKPFSLVVANSFSHILAIILEGVIDTYLVRHRCSDSSGP